MSNKVIQYQYDLFDAPLSEVDELKLRLVEIKASQDKIRKGLFAKHGELAKMYLELQHEFESLKRDICRHKA